jgi:O-antigen ligase
MATLTRGPIVAAAVAVVGVLVLSRARLLGIGVLAISVLAVAFMLPTLRSTELYRDRVADSANVRFREVVRDWSLRLAAEKPVFGWGYGSFDRVKNTSGFHAEGVPIRNVLTYTSHDTYLTLLVELGLVGLLLFASPFLVLGFMGVARARAPGPDRWLLVAGLGSLLVIFLTANTLDFRFFSLAQVLPFVYLAILRRGTAAPRPTA